MVKAGTGKIAVSVDIDTLTCDTYWHCLVLSVGQDTDGVRIQSIDISPDPPKPGKDLTVTVTGIAKERIEVCQLSNRCHLSV